ncbi:MAG: Hsp20/alpha crystallin family protein [Actinomycetota bacterium]|jgi:HSP20 family protein|nr:Hsp20/alpha crystallin family protein [Actinomycetota bacterium]
MGKARRNPFRGVLDTISEMNRMQEQWMMGYDSSPSGGGVGEDQPRTHATAWVPATDIFADGNDLKIRCELSGVKREEIDISLTAGILIVSGQRTSELDEEATSFLVRERFYGEFRRSINLPENVGNDNISARFENGMLEVTVKGGAIISEPRQIQIS